MKTQDTVIMPLDLGAVSCVFMTLECWYSIIMILTNQSTVSY